MIARSYRRAISTLIDLAGRSKEETEPQWSYKLLRYSTKSAFCCPVSERSKRWT
jgi:hypothetical protein